MKTDLREIQITLQEIFKKFIPPLKVNKDNEATFELTGTKEGMQGKQKVDGYYFGSVVPKPKDTRLYYFPIYTHPTAFENISPELRKCLKGKSCFHIKNLSPELENEIEEMVAKGVKLYVDDGLI